MPLIVLRFIMIIVIIAIHKFIMINIDIILVVHYQRFIVKDNKIRMAQDNAHISINGIIVDSSSSPFL